MVDGGGSGCIEYIHGGWWRFWLYTSKYNKLCFQNRVMKTVLCMVFLYDGTHI